MITEAEADLRAMELEQVGRDDAAAFIRDLHAELRRAVGMMPRGLREMYEAREAAARQVRT